MKPQRVEELICGHSMMTGQSYTEENLNSLVDLISNESEKELAQLRLDLAKVCDTLEWYANRDNWKFESYKNDCKDVVDFSDIGVKSFNGQNNFADYACGSGGKRARECLASLKRGEGER